MAWGVHDLYAYHPLYPPAQAPLSATCHSFVRVLPCPPFGGGGGAMIVHPQQRTQFHGLPDLNRPFAVDLGGGCGGVRVQLYTHLPPMVGFPPTCIHAPTMNTSEEAQGRGMQEQWGPMV